MSDDHQFIRGQRILDQLNEMSSYPKLYDNIERGFPTTKKRQHATGEVTVTNTQYIPYVGMKMLHIKALTTSNGHQYAQSLQFLRVTYETEDTESNITFQGTDGRDYHIAPITLTDHNVKVKCNCLDFFHRFAHYNAQDKSLIGRPPPLYQRKTDRPPVNPLRVPGLCKHLLKVIETLEGTGIISD